MLINRLLNHQERLYIYSYYKISLHTHTHTHTQESLRTEHRNNNEGSNPCENNFVRMRPHSNLTQTFYNFMIF